jgi:hypothetical protein
VAASTASAAAVPTLGRPPTGTPGNKGFGKVKPSVIYLGGDPTGLVQHIVWKSWGGSRAVGTGTGWYVPPTSDVAGGQHEQATVVAFNLGTCDGELMYRAVDWYFPQYGQTFHSNEGERICAWGSAAFSLSGVSCNSSANCVAVGYYDSAGRASQQTLVESKSKKETHWHVLPSPNPGNGGQLDSVSCANSTNCVAVGQHATGPVIESWNGSVWSVTPSVNPGGSEPPSLSGVSCSSPTSCVAVGDYLKPNVGFQSLIESWNGTSWSITPSPNQGSSGNFLYGVSCTSSTNCVAVGKYVNASFMDQTLIDSWNGTSWSITPSPDQVSGGQLDSVSCTSSTNCVAVGESFEQAGAQTLIESWNGTSWSITPSPDQGSGGQLDGVSCTSSTNCVAVGQLITGSVIASWNGSVWSVIPTVNQGGGEQPSLSGVSCNSQTSCVAVGDYHNSESPPKSFVESWNGTSWSRTGKGITPPRTATSSTARLGPE